MAYRIYISDSLFYQSQQQRLTNRYSDILNRKVDTRTGDEIINDVIAGAGLRFKEE